VADFSPASPASEHKPLALQYLKDFVVKKEDFENVKLPQIRNLILKNISSIQRVYPYYTTTRQSMSSIYRARESLNDLSPYFHEDTQDGVLPEDLTDR
jgi:hypothetical protein